MVVSELIDMELITHEREILAECKNEVLYVCHYRVLYNAFVYVLWISLVKFLDIDKIKQIVVLEHGYGFQCMAG